MNTDVVLKQICAEKWDNQMSHLLYSIGLMIVQVIMIKGPISRLAHTLGTVCFIILQPP